MSRVSKALLIKAAHAGVQATLNALPQNRDNADTVVGQMLALKMLSDQASANYKALLNTHADEDKYREELEPGERVVTFEGETYQIIASLSQPVNRFDGSWLTKNAPELLGVESHKMREAIAKAKRPTKPSLRRTIETKDGKPADEQ